MRESRLNRRSLKQSKHSLYFSISAIVIILILAFNFGPLLIGGLGGVIDTITGKGNQTEQILTSDDLQPPTLDALPNATPSASINISGRSYYANGTIALYVNNAKRDELDLSDSQDFTFEDVKLSEGINNFKVRIIIGDKESEFSEEEQIIYSKSEPKLELSFPQDHQAFGKGDQQITVRGVTDPDNNVRVNGFIAIVDSSGNFLHVYNLSSGENKISVVSTSQAGQTTTKEVTVSYSE